jgi:hypothetical protein
MAQAQLDSVDMDRFLSGDNLFAVQTPDKSWEILQAKSIELIGIDHYRAHGLLRGRFGSDADMTPLEAGARIVCLKQGLGD